ncbi:hypothetical protein GQR58_020529 [Nymphon striatum]|nr:hypothetical protein GQR58_020529 [Nymphon striatum]
MGCVEIDPAANLKANNMYTRSTNNFLLDHYQLYAMYEEQIIISNLQLKPKYNCGEITLEHLDIINYKFSIIIFCLKQRGKCGCYVCDSQKSATFAPVSQRKKVKKLCYLCVLIKFITYNKGVIECITLFNICDVTTHLKYPLDYQTIFAWIVHYGCDEVVMLT